jgi:hypothetical protein
MASLWSAGWHASVRELQDAISEFIAVPNQNPEPFVWTKTADQSFLDAGCTRPGQLCKKSMTQETSTAFPAKRHSS